MCECVCVSAYVSCMCVCARARVCACLVNKNVDTSLLTLIRSSTLNSSEYNNVGT